MEEKKKLENISSVEKVTLPFPYVHRFSVFKNQMSRNNAAKQDHKLATLTYLLYSGYFFMLVLAVGIHAVQQNFSPRLKFVS